MLASQYTKLLFLTAAGLTLASPAVPRQDVSSSDIPTATGTAYGGAMDTTAPRPTPDIEVEAATPAHLTIRIINKQGAAISTAHFNAPGPGPVSGNTLPGTIANGATAAFAVPTGWAGNVNLVSASGKITGDNSLIEANYKVPSGYSHAVADVDVSDVNGWSVAIQCKCGGKKVTGCTENLSVLHKCPNNNGVGACKNPLRADIGATAPTAYFAPCAGQAYTYPDDNKANSFGQCQGGIIECCVGTSC